MARPGRDFASAAVRNTCTVTYAPVPQSADTGTSTSAPPAGTARLRTECTRSDSTSSVASPANGGAMWMRAVSPGAYALRSAETSTWSGTSGLSEDTQPARNRTDVPAMPPSSSTSMR